MRVQPHDSVLLKSLKGRPRGLERILEHFETCAKCRNRKQASSLEGRFRRTGKLDYEPVLDRSFQRLATREAVLARERSEAPGLFSHLSRLPIGRQQILLRNSRRFQTWGLLELLIHRGREETFIDLVHAEEILRLASEALLARARDGFLSVGNRFDGELVSRELAAVAPG